MINKQQLSSAQVSEARGAPSYRRRRHLVVPQSDRHGRHPADELDRSHREAAQMRGEQCKALYCPNRRGQSLSELKPCSLSH